MGLSEYEVEVNGFPTTLQLSDEDAKAMGLAKAAAKEAKAPANKARTAGSNQRAEAAAQAFGA